MKRIWRVLRDQQGFTLVELMVVVIILGILAAIAVPQFLNKTEAARENATMATLSSIKSAIDVWANDYDNGGKGKYPKDEAELGNALNAAGITWNGLKDGWGRSYHYSVKDDQTEYVIFSHGKDGNIGGGDDITAGHNSSPLKNQSAELYDNSDITS